jgi:GT2 family glycosyltransferase
MVETEIRDDAPRRVSVILVAHNQAAGLRRAIQVLESASDRDRFEILLVDLGSEDQSGRLDDEFPNVTVLRLPHHFGATKAMNIATRTAKGQYLFFLSPNAEPAANTVDQLASHLDGDDAITAAVPLLVDSAGRATPHIWKLPTREFFAASAGGALPPSVAVDETAGSEPVEFASLEALMIRKQFVQSMNYFDSRYGHYWADADLAMQIYRAAKRMRVYPGIRVTWHPGEDPLASSSAFAADRVLGAAAFLARYHGFMAGLTFRLGATFRALFTFRLGEFGALVSGQKVDGN